MFTAVYSIIPVVYKGTFLGYDAPKAVHSARNHAVVKTEGIKTSCGDEMPIDWMGYGYSALIVIGGIVGYVKAGSVPSLAAGLLFGGFAGLGTYKICQNPKHVWVLLATSASLAGVMGFRFLNSGKFMPAGLMAAASLVILGKTGLGMLQRPHGP